MTSSKILVMVDFDHTIIEENTSVEVRSLLGDRELPKEIEALAQVKGGWTAYMRELFRHLAQNCKVTRDDYMRLLAGLSPTDGMRELILQMHESGDCEIIVVSDSNSFFIQAVLRQHHLSNAVARVFSNPAEFDAQGCLQIREFQHQSQCSRCPINMCKGNVLVNYVAKRLTEGVQFCRTLFIGDGSNDVCAALRLGVNDYVFARSGYRLLRSLEKMPAKNVKANVVPWETAFDIKNVLLSS